MTSQDLLKAIQVFDDFRSTGIHTRTVIILLAVWEEEGLKQVEYAKKLQWKIQIINRHALSLEREGYVDLIHVDSDPRGRARAIVLKPHIREKIASIFASSNKT